MYKRVWNTALTANTTTAEEELGVVREEYDTTSRYRAFVYVQAASDTTVANGTALAYSDTDRVTATSDFSTANVNQVAGVGIGAITASSYGWIQIRGYHSAVLTNGDDDITDGLALVLAVATDGTVDSATDVGNATAKIVGYAVAADVDADDTVAAQLEIF